MNAIDSVIDLKEKHRETWRDRDDAFWLSQFLEEVAELILSVHGKHEHSPDVELRQIASIAMNWLEIRESNRLCENCHEPMGQHVGVHKLCKNGEWNTWGKSSR